jgi:hypothetical protein
MNVDNRIMLSVGIAAMKMGLVKGEDVEGIPISRKGKTSTSTERHRSNHSLISSASSPWSHACIFKPQQS